MKENPLVLLAIMTPLLMAGCDEGVDLGHPPPVLVQTQRRAVSLQRQGGQERLSRAIAAVTNGNPQRVRAVIHARSSRQFEATRRLLVRLGIEPVRIRESAEPGPDVELSGAVALTAPCASAIDPVNSNPLSSMHSLTDCIQTNNLARMVADPADLVAPPPLGPGDGIVLADGVHEWQTAGHAQAKAQTTHETANVNVAPAATTTSSQTP